jgi:hypothetical protein
MQPSTPPSSSRTALRRYGPLAAIVVVIALVAVIVAVSRGSSKSTNASTATTVAGPAAPAGVLSWTQAKAEGKTKSINWGSRCDTTIGKLKYPSFFAGDCYAPFTGDNGGSTSPGVTATSIKVVLYLPQPQDPILKFIEGAISDTDTNAQTVATTQGFVKFYETYYETYGRKVDLVPFTATGNATDEVAARADATQIAESIKPFAVWGGPALTSAFADELAADKVLCIDCEPGQLYSWYASHAPYVWDLGMGPEQAQAQVAEYVGKRLQGRPAAYAGDPALQTQTRKFGVIYISTGPNSDVVEKEFEQSLAKYGVSLGGAVLAYKSPLDLQNDGPGMIAKLKSLGVTSVIFNGDPVAPGTLTKIATGQNYFPEWVLAGAGLTDTSIFARTYDQTQWKHAFGVSFLAARTDPSVSGTKFLYQWFTGQPTPSETGSALTVADLALFYAAVQGIGPQLTPQNFQAALFAAAPTAHALTQPSLSFGNKGIWPQTDYNGIDDATEVWWNPTAPGADEVQKQGTGLYEYVDGGKRYLPGQWPTTAPDVFNPTGAVTIYTQVPAAEKVPNYPSPAPPG